MAHEIRTVQKTSNFCTMKTIVFFSSLFFFLGLMVSNLIDLRGKTEAVETIVTNKIKQSNPVKALPLFKNQENDTEEVKKTETETAVPIQQTKPKE